MGAGTHCASAGDQLLVLDGKPEGGLRVGRVGVSGLRWGVRGCLKAWTPDQFGRNYVSCKNVLLRQTRPIKSQKVGGADKPRRHLFRHASRANEHARMHAPAGRNPCGHAQPTGAQRHNGQIERSSWCARYLPPQRRHFLISSAHNRAPRLSLASVKMDPK